MSFLLAGSVIDHHGELVGVLDELGHEGIKVSGTHVLTLARLAVVRESGPSGIRLTARQHIRRREKQEREAGRRASIRH